MLKKLLTLLVALGLSLSTLVASAVEVNTADQTALESVKGIGPAHAQAILAERAAHGPFKDADDLASRVKGLGPKSVQNLEAAGLTINGSSTPPAANAAAAKGGKAAASAKGATGSVTAATTATAPTAPTAPTASTAPTANSTTATPGAASDAQTRKGRKSKKAKAASAASASGA